MQEGTTSEAEVIRLRQNIETQMRRRILEAIELKRDYDRIVYAEDGLAARAAYDARS